MAGEDQLKSLIRQAFSLNNTADKAVIDVDSVLARSMVNVKRFIEQLPEGSLLRNQAWKQLEPFVRQEMKIYADQLGDSIQSALVDAEEGMERTAIRQAKLGGASFGPETIRTTQPGNIVANSVELALKTKVNNQTVKKLFNIGGRDESPVARALFKSIDTRVRAGIIQGKTTQDIADEMAIDVISRGVPGVQLTADVAKNIRSQAMTMARTATQDMNRQVKNEVYDANADALEGMQWQWTTALDSKTCEICMPLDGSRTDTKEGHPDYPIHPNCRCQVLPIDPEDPFWDDNEVSARQIRPVDVQVIRDGKPVFNSFGEKVMRKTKPRGNELKTPIIVNGKRFYQKPVTVTSNKGPARYSDVLAKWAKDKDPTSINEALGPTRASWFRKEAAKKNADPQQILQSMLTGKPGAQKWIPITELDN